jgi:uncharacterized protein involved in response to NO
MSIRVERPEPPRRAPVARRDPAFPWFIGSAFGLALAGGFVLALLLPLAVVLGWDWGIRWRALVQAHGHLQVTGWIGLFVAGMALRLAPRFAGRPLRFPWTSVPAVALLVAGLIARTIAEPWLDVTGMRALLIAGAAAEVGGSALVALSVISTLAPSIAALPSASLMMTGAIGMVAQAMLSLAFLARLTADDMVLAMNRDAALLALQFYAFLLPFVLGVALRSLPTFFARPAPAPRWAWAIAALLAAGSALLTAGPLDPGATGARLEGLGSVLVAAAIVAGISRTAVWRRAERLRPSARPPALLVQTAFAWLALGCIALAYTGIAALWHGRPFPPYQADAVRHIFGLGVFSTLVAGMSELMLPWMAQRRQRQGALRREVVALWALFTGATILRVTGALLEGRGVGVSRYSVVAAAGVLGILAVAFLAATVLRAARQPSIYPVLERSHHDQ